MHSLSEVASLLGCRDPRRITKCMQYAGIDPQEDERDKRQRLLTDAQVERLREVYAHLYTYTSSADLEARVAALEQQVATLLSRYAGNLTPPIHSTVYDPPRRASASTVRHARTPARPPLPAQLMSIPTWYKLHGVAEGTVKTWRERRYLPVERGQWLEAGVRIDTALTLEGREMAHQLAHLPWPCEVCVGEENETTPTHAVVEVARHDVVEE